MIDNNKLQHDAANPNHSVYVSASAGSGKTKVLIDRILRLLLAGTDISNILCITFTKVAAEEMLVRLKDYAKKWAFLPEEILVQELADLTKSIVTDEVITCARSLYMRLLQQRSKIKIQTIHAFCANILNIKVDHSHNSDREVISDADQSEFLSQAFDSALSEQGIVSEVQILAAVYSIQTIFEYSSEIVKQYSKFSKYLTSFENDIDLSNMMAQVFNIDLNLDLDQYIQSQVLHLASGDIKRVANSISHSSILDWLGQSPEDQIKNLDDYILIFLTKEHQPRARIVGANKLAVDDAQFLKNYQSSIYQLAENIKSHRLAGINLAFIKFARAMFNQYNKLKYTNNLLDYDELLIDAIKSLSASEYKDWLLWRLDCEIDHILVDEAQDLNSYQWHIINLLADEFFAGEGAKDINRTIFIVGDLKQSIFSFQGAEPNIFHDIKYYYRKKAADAHKSWLEIDFSVSYRSGVEVLEVVDKIFVDDSEAFGHSNYCPHISYRQTHSIVELWPLVTADDDEQEAEGWRMPREYSAMSNKYTMLSDMIVGHISNWLNSKRTIAGTNKIIEPSDIMIVLRKRGPIYYHLISRLKDINIPVISGASSYLTDYLIVLDILSVAKFVLNPFDDFNLVSLLKSHFFNMTENEIFLLTCSPHKQSAWEKVCTYCTLNAQKNALNDIILIYQTSSLYQFFYTIIFKYLRPNLDKNDISFNTIINSLLESVSEFENSIKFNSLESFLKWFKSSEKQVCNTQHIDNAIKITTVHSAKGLQSAIVIVADASESENLRHDGFFWHDNKLIFSGNAQNETALIRSIKAHQKHKNYQENKRLLYVALTRACDELYIAGVENRRSGTWYEIISKHSS